jgi:hypothetical protein
VYGVILTVWSDTDYTTFSLTILLTGNLLSSLKTIYTNFILKKHNIPTITMIYILSPISSLILLIISVFNGELFLFYNNFQNIFDIKTGNTKKKKKF